MKLYFLKTKTYFFKSIILAFILAMTFSFFPNKKSSAWDAIPGAMAKQAMENLQKTIDGITLAAAKQAAIKMILEEVNRAIDDVTGMGTRFITDWEDYIIGIPERESTKFMNDYLSQITQGRNSSRYRNIPVAKTLSYAENYEGFGGRNSTEFALIKQAQAEETTDTTTQSSGALYTSSLQAMVEEITDTTAKTPPKLTCTDEMRNEMFGGDNFDNFWECTEGINYAPMAYAHFKAVHSEVLTNKKAIQAPKQSQGFLPTETEDGYAIAPAGTNAAIQTEAETMGMKAIATATSFQELITAAVLNAVTRSINQGIGAVKARLQRELSNTRRKMTNQMRDNLRSAGPQAMFGR